MNRLIRLDDSCWSFQPTENRDHISELQLHIPDVKASHAYAVANCVSTIFSNNPDLIDQKKLQSGIDIQITKMNSDHPIHGTWRIVAHQINDTLAKSITQYIPFLQKIKNRQVERITISKVPESIWENTIAIFNKSIFEQYVDKKNIAISIAIDETLNDRWLRIAQDSFQDPFTTIATVCLNTVEPHFVMEHEHIGSWRFVVHETEKQLQLQKISTKNTIDNQQEAEENRRSIEIYRQYLEDEFGSWFVDFLRVNYAIDFDAMIENGLPLLPDHISKCNIGAQNIEIYHAHDLMKRLHQVHEILQKNSSMQESGSIADLFLPIEKEHGVHFSVRELRGLARAIAKRADGPEAIRSRLQISFAEAQSYLKMLFEDEFRPLFSENSNSFCNEIISMLTATDEERDRSFTGRKIRHISIMGFHTMGNKQIPSPARDMFELLHIFSDLQTSSNWPNYYELLGHVVAKKSLYRKTHGSNNPQNEAWHVGLLIPAPNQTSGEKRWYYNRELVDDGCGNVNYTLLPVIDHSSPDWQQTAPAIKLYRSTASDHNAMNWQDSLQADFNPYGSPGSLNPEISYEYEKKLFFDRTIPLWIAYSMLAFHLMKKMKATNDSESCAPALRGYLSRAIDHLGAYLKEKKSQRADAYVSILSHKLLQQRYSEIQSVIVQLAELHEELPQNKINQNMAFVGHSLGGALAQFGTHFFGPRVGRIPMPKCNFICYSSDGTGIDNDRDIAFMEFGREHRSLLSELGQRWEIFHQFEFGDIVPQAGGSHLGTNGYDKDVDPEWLHFRARVFKPLPTATAPSITTAPTHGRRIGTAQFGHDYRLTILTPKELFAFDHAYLLDTKLSKEFGYRFFKSPKAAEKIRQIISKVSHPFGQILKANVSNTVGNRDERGVFYIAQLGLD